jgi:hypothetical protein
MDGLENMQDLGSKFSRDKTFCFDKIIVHEIIFDDSNDVTLFCAVPYFGQMYTANFGLSFAQLDFIIRSTNNAHAVSTVLAEHLEAQEERPSVIDVEKIYGHPLEISNCVLYTTLYDLLDEEEDDEGGEDEDLEKGEEDDSEYEAYAFVIDHIRIKSQLEN